MNKSRSISEQDKNQELGGITVQELTTPVVKKGIKIEEEGSAKSHLCDLCDSNFANASNLKRHNSTQHTDIKKIKEDPNSSCFDKDGEKSLQCNLCDISFVNGFNLRRHMSTKHTDVKKEDNSDEHFMCELCDHAFTEQKGLVIHKGMKHRGMFKGDKEPKDENLDVLNCDLCSYSCTEERNMKIHKSMKHTGKKVTHDQDSSRCSTVRKNEKTIYKCDLCEYSCPKESSLKIHKTMKHKEKEKFEEKLMISQSLFRKKTNMTEENKKLQCSKCDFTGTSEKELRYHRFRNHRLAFIKKEEKLETDNDQSNEVFLIEEPANISEVSLDLNDTLMSVDEDYSLNMSMNDAGKKVYYESKAEFLEKSEYFKAFPGNILSWNGNEEDLSPGEGLPEGFGVKKSVTRGGKKYMVHVTPDRVFKLRSLVAVLEYMKSCGKYSQEDLQTFELKIKAKSL